MSKWIGKVALKHLLHRDDMSFEQTRDAVVAAVRASSWYGRSDEFSTLHGVVEEMADARTVDGFDEALDALYDEADYDRIWIA